MMADDHTEAEALEPEARPADPRAEAFQGVREARRNELAEDYVELIAELIAPQVGRWPFVAACLIGVAPLRPAEFVIFRIGQMASGGGVEE